MTTVEVFAPAKINLTLHVTGQRPDGYHELDSLVAFADIGDTVRAAPADVTSLTIDGPQGGGCRRRTTWSCGPQVWRAKRRRCT